MNADKAKCCCGLSQLYPIVLRLYGRLFIINQAIIIFSSMKAKQQKSLSYSILTDPHMYYFLQSPQKVKDLLKTSLYRLEGANLVQIATKLTLKLDDYVIQKVMSQPIPFNDPDKELNDVINSQKFRAFEREREKLKKMRLQSPNKMTKSANFGNKNDYSGIKGLKEFMAKKIL